MITLEFQTYSKNNELKLLEIDIFVHLHGMKFDTEKQHWDGP